MRQATIDIGTNTCLLLVAEADRSGGMTVLADVHAIARLGEGVDKSKKIQNDAYGRLKKILLDHKKVIEKKQAKKVTAIGTSAMRDAENRDEIIKKVKGECGFEIELISGDDESLWSYRGAMCGLPKEELEGMIGALDIGGGSTELSIGENGKYKHGKSIDVGAVRITERFLSEKNEASRKQAKEFARKEIEKGFKNITGLKKLIAVAGTPTALASVKLKLQTFDAMKVNGVILSQSELRTMTRELSSLSAEEISKKYPAVHPSRADILPAGALILEEIMEYLDLKEVKVSSCGLRYGIMIREFEKKLGESDEWQFNFSQ